MRRFVITSPSWDGEAEIVYDAGGRLIRLSVEETDMEALVIEQFKKRVGATIDKVGAIVEGTNATLVEADFNITLDDFKREYPYSRNYHLLDGIWPRLKKSVQVQCYYGAIEYRKWCERQFKNYKPMIAATWINNKEYLNNWKKL